MTKILKALRQSFESFGQLKVLALILAPPLVAFVLSLLVFSVYWSDWIRGLESFFQSTWLIQNLADGLTSLGVARAQNIALALAGVFLVLLFLPLTILLAIIITSIFVMPLVLEMVRRKSFPQLEKKKGGSILGSLLNTLLTSVVFVVAFAATLPLWLLPGCQIAIPVVLSAWMNKRIFVYDVLQDFASLEERKTIESREKGNLYGMGVLLGLSAYIPFVFFAIPVLSALSYTYYCLNELEALRRPRT